MKLILNRINGDVVIIIFILISILYHVTPPPYFFHVQEITQQESERSDLRFEAWKPVFVKRDMGVYMIDL